VIRRIKGWLHIDDAVQRGDRNVHQFTGRVQ
jgi:hypothetical protein